MGVRGSTEKGTRSGDQYRIKETIMRLTYPWLAAIFIYMGTWTSVGAAMAAQAGWEEVVKAAEKEGEVTVYATNSVGDLTVIWDAFKKRYPKIKLNSVGISTTSEIRSEEHTSEFQSL